MKGEEWRRGKPDFLIALFCFRWCVQLCSLPLCAGSVICGGILWDIHAKSRKHQRHDIFEVSGEAFRVSCPS